jgi:hypothetical protein
MATMNRGILGGIKGKIGNVVGSSWKGIAVLKSLPLSVANPNTAGQQLQRGKMTQVVAVGRILIASLIQRVWNPVAVKMTGFNYFVKENIAAFSQSAFATPSAFFISRGTLLGQVIATAVADASDDTITLTWADNDGQGDALGTDLAFAVAYNATQDYWLVSDFTDTRADESIVIADTAVAVGNTMHAWLGFARPNYSKIATSDYSVVTVQA